MLRRSTPARRPPLTGAMQSICFQKAKHCIKDLMEDIADERSEHLRLGSTYYIDWKQVNSQLNQNIEIISIAEDQGKIRLKAPKILSFYVHPEEYTSLIKVLKVPLLAGVLFLFLGIIFGMTVGHNSLLVEHAVSFFYSFNSSIVRGGVLGGMFGLTCGVSVGIGVMANSLYGHLRRFPITTTDIFSTFEDFVTNGTHVLATIDVGQVRTSDLSENEE